MLFVDNLFFYLGGQSVSCKASLAALRLYGYFLWFLFCYYRKINMMMMMNLQPLWPPSPNWGVHNPQLSIGRVVGFPYILVQQAVQVICLWIRWDWQQYNTKSIIL